MGELALISIGLSDEKDISLRGIEEARSCDRLYVEFYTSVLNTTLQKLSELLGKPITQLRRKDLEESAEVILREAERSRVGILVGGDSLAATTHIALLLEARKRGINTKVVHGSTALTAIAETGLSLYHFGKTATIPMSSKGSLPTSPYLTLEENLGKGLHTLLLLDLDVEKGESLSLNDAFHLMLKVEAEEGKGVFTEDTLVVGAARLGSDTQLVKAGKLSELLDLDFGPPPQILIVPGGLHFIEEEALKVLCQCKDEDLRERRRFVEDVEWRARKYIESCKRVLRELEFVSDAPQRDDPKVKELLGYADMYLEDAKYYLEAGRKASSLASVGYCEGILDALRLMKLVKFEW